MPRILPQVVIDGKQLAVTNFRAERGSYGAIGSASFTTSVEKLRDAKLNVLAANQQAPGSEASLPISISISVDGGSSFTKLWAGDMDSSDFQFQEDMVSFRARDYAGRLYDDRIVLKADQYQNKRPYEIATALAKDAQLTPKVTVDTSQPLAGSLYEIDAVSLALPRPKWDVLVFLARSVGWEVFTTPNQELVFGPPVPGTPHVFTWKAGPNTPGIPVMNPHVEYQPRRNMTFQVLVLSQHPKTEEVVSERIIVLNQPITVESFKTARAGVWKGSAAQRLRSAISDKLNGRPLYIFYPQGKTLQQVQGLAERLYYDIARKLFIASGEVDGLPALQPQDTIQLVEANSGDLQGFAGQQLSLVNMTHRYQMTRGKGANEAGFMTEWKAHFLPQNPNPAEESPIVQQGGD